MDLIPVSKTKIVPPRRRNELLTRKRLLDLLFDALDKKLALVSAPAGYGKTSLLIDLAVQSELPCCWLALDELDRDPQRFAAYFIAALAEQFPKFGAQSKNVLEKMSSFDLDMERLLVTICNEILATIREHFIFVLDDFHLLDGVQQIQNFINRFLQLMDENCHLVISSRVLTSLTDLPLLVAREQVSGLSFLDLAFQPQELQALLAQNNKRHISDEQASQLIAEAEGWITGLQFSGADIVPRNSTSLIRDEGSALFDYLGQQVLDRQPGELQEFILRTAQFEEFDAALCERVFSPFYSEKQDWQKWIKSISNNNLFALPVGADGRWLRYHHLFRDFIRMRFERDRQQEMLPILSRLEAAYEEMGEWEKAHFICRKLEDVELLAGMIERSSSPMLQRAIITLESWLNELPPSVLRKRPGLISIRGAIVCSKGDTREGLLLLTQAEQVFRKDKNTYELNLTLIRRVAVHRLMGNYDASLQDAEEVIQSTQASDEMRLFYAEALRHKGLVLFRLGRARESVPLLERSMDIFQQHDETIIPVLLMETGMVYRATGNFLDARRSYDKALHILRQSGNLSWQAGLLNNMGGMYHLQGEYEKAVFAFEEGLLCAQSSNNARFELLILRGLGDLFTEMEDFSMAEQNYQSASEAIYQMEDRFLLYSLSVSRINLALFHQELAEAHSMIEEIAASMETSPSNYESGFLGLLRGRLSILEADPHKAIGEIKKAEEYFLEDGRELEVSVARVWRLAASMQAGDRAEARLILKELHGTRGKVPHAVLVAVHQAHPWLENLQKITEVSSMARDLLAQAGRFAHRIPDIRRQLRRQTRVVQSPTPHLTIQAFGQAGVDIGGKRMSLSDWQTQSVREFFFYLLTNPKPMTKEQIGDSLWPEMTDPAKLKLRFKNEIYRLRKAVGQEAILFKDIYYSFNRAIDYEYDVEAFEAYLARAKTAAQPEQQMEFYQKAVDLVSGPFLNDIYADWTMADRERMGQLHLHALSALGNLYQANARLEDAMRVCQRAIAVSPAFEPAYQTIMQVHHRHGDRASVKAAYRACVAAVKRQFGLPPSQETEDLYQRLIQ